jgi:hypothetical protein
MSPARRMTRTLLAVCVACCLAGALGASVASAEALTPWSGVNSAARLTNLRAGDEPLVAAPTA